MPKKKGKILVVDDNAGIRSALKLLLPVFFSEVELLPSPKELMEKVRVFCPDAVLLDMNFQSGINTGNEGLYWLGELKKKYSSLPVVLFTAYADIALAVEGMKRGAFDFVVKPWENAHLVSILQLAVQRSAQEKSGQPSKVDPVAPGMYWGEGERMQVLKGRVEKVAPTEANILITGENGTGKDMLACEIHRQSMRRGKPMVSVDLGALSESLFESELFGHVKGAFTDARTDHAGKFEQANGGTLFLDEVGNIPLHLQAKLLRVLQNRQVVPLGGSRPIAVDIRLICATNADLRQRVADGLFREDLYYRINTVELHLPPLRERKDEILPLSGRFLKEFSTRYGRMARDFSSQVKDGLLSCRWNGNIRELRNVVEKAVIISDSEVIGADVLELPVSGSAKDVITDHSQEEETLEMAEERLIRSAMNRYSGNLTLVARALNISRPTLYSKLKKYNI